MRPKDKTCTYPDCPRCTSNFNVRKKGHWDVNGVKSQRFHCSKCNFHFKIPEVKEDVTTTPE